MTLVTSTRGRAFAAAGFATVVLALAGCSSSSGPTVAALGSGATAGSSSSPSSSVDRETAARDFAACMRSNGVPTFPDPTVDSSGNVQLGIGPNSGFDRNDPKVRAAFTACQSKLQALRPNFTPEQQQQLQDALLKYAQCMRSNGYQMADPDFSGNGGGFRALGNINRQDPAFQKADAICRPQTLGKLGFGGPRFGGGPNGGNPPASTSAPSTTTGAAA